jgi:UrcA family protein
MNTITSTPLRTLVAGALLGALALSFASVSSAEEDTTPPQAVVKYTDLDVSTSQGAAILYGRIHSAATSVCWRMYNNEAAFRRHKDVCLQQVIADAVTKVDQPALSAVFASKYGTARTILAAAGTR